MVRRVELDQSQTIAQLEYSTAHSTEFYIYCIVPHTAYCLDLSVQRTGSDCLGQEFDTLNKGSHQLKKSASV